MKAEHSLKQVVAAIKEQVSSDLGGEAIILSLNPGIYFGVNETGAFVWNLIQQPISLEEIKERILKEYEVDEDRCEKDLFELVDQLKSKGLVEFIDG